jgi:hypothetical protein
MTERFAADRTLVHWLATLRGGHRHPGVAGRGLAGTLLGLRAATAVRPELGRPGGLLDITRRGLLARVARVPWRSDALDWRDYDLMTGPAGAVRVLAGDPGVAREDLGPAVGHLVHLARTMELDGFRIGRYHGARVSGWHLGQVNTGVSHGVSGVVLALCAVADAYGLGAPVAGALRRIAGWLRRHAYRDSRGIITWLPGGPPWPDDDPYRPADQRQAWCYGTPGVSWALWETGRVLRDAELVAFAEEAFESFLAVPDANHNASARERDAMCHGSAGLLVVCDAFARHAGLPSAAVYRDRLAAELTGTLDELPPWIDDDASLLHGPIGVVLALLAPGSADRTWLTALGLR